MASDLERAFETQLKALGVEGWVTEHRFAPPRRWRFDFAWTDRKIAVELQGGTWAAGRHSRGAGYDKDCEKANAAALSGWTVLRYTSTHVNDWSAARQVADTVREAQAALATLEDK